METIAYAYTETGALAGRFVMGDDHDAPHTYEGPHDYFPALADGRVTVRAMWIGRTAREDYYETPGTSALDAAWERIREGENAEGIGEYLRTDDEAVELFTRYLRVFHPLVAVREAWVTTSYCQGDAVWLIGWSDGARATYLEAAQDHELIGKVFDFIGEFARGQFVSVAYESASMSSISVDGDELTARVEWQEVDRIGGVHYADEFNAGPEALRVAVDCLSIPDDLVIMPEF